MIFLVLSEKMILLFPENMILFFRRKVKDNLFQKKKKEKERKKIRTWKYDIFCIFGKDVVPFSFIYDVTLLPKKPSKLLPKIILKDDISVSLKKVIFILENMVFLLIEKLKMIKKFTQSNTHRDNNCD